MRQPFRKLLFRQGILFLVGLALIHNFGTACTLIIVGKGASVDGSVLLAHNNDLPDKVASLIQIVPGIIHRGEDMITFRNGLTIPQAERTYRMLIMNCYYGFSEGDAVAVNEHGVAVGGGQSLKDDRSDKARLTDPLIPKGVSGYIRYIALQRSRTALECVETIGRLYSTYGIAYPSGVGVADANEAWYIEAGGGRCWAAVRVPPDSYMAAANGYRIGFIDFNDKKNFRIPPYLKSIVVKKGLWDPDSGPFHFARTFGGRSGTHNPYYNSRRVWRVQNLLSPTLKQSPEATEQPVFLKPERKISLEQLSAILRDHYQGTIFDTTRGSFERAVGIIDTVHTDIIQLRNWLPAEIGTVMWAGIGSALTTPYIPYYLGIKEISRPFRTAGPIPGTASAYWNFRDLADIMEADFPSTIPKVLPAIRQFETTLFALQPVIEKTSLGLYQTDKELALDFLTLYSNGLALQSLQHAEELIQNLSKK